MTEGPASFDQSPRIERRALRIADPVARLRFLRRATAPASKSRFWFLPIGFHGVLRPQLRHLGWAALALMLAIAPGPVPTGTAGMVVRERRLVAPSWSGNVPAAVPRVWLVERSEASELYSNGLRIDLTFTVSNHRRQRYPVFSLAGAGPTSKNGAKPVGIVFHTTESNLAPFEEDENRRLKQLGRNLLEVIRRERSYHYVIDRFGRVFRVVEEADAANHAGSSVWADTEGIYVNLNNSFLGVAFEAQTGAVDEVTPAQISAAKVLTEMLRARYDFPGENCVTHAQVSVNPLNMRIGAHTDWAHNFPFAKLGLPDNYVIPLPSLYAFGFVYDEVFLEATGEAWKGMDLAVDQVQRQAAAEGIPATRYRAILRHRYKDIVAALKDQEAAPSLDVDTTPPRSVVRASKKRNGGA